MPARLWNTLCVGVALLCVVTTADATGAAVRLASSAWGHGRDVGEGGHVFSYIRWLRDSAVETFFGLPRTTQKSDKRAAEMYNRYRNDVVVRFNVSHAEQERALSEATERLLLDVWAFSPDHVDIRLHQDDASALLKLLPSDLQPTLLPLDVAAAVLATYPLKDHPSNMLEAENIDGITARSGIEKMFFQDYQTLSVIQSWMRLIEAMYPSYVQIISVGTSYEGRDIAALRMRTNKRQKDSEGDARETILITGGLHAREWISVSTVNYVMWQFITRYRKDAVVTKIMDNIDLVFVPVLNPDGYEYTWDKDRLWRKSRQQTNMRFCRGLDLDRAFGYAWESTSHAMDPCSESYGGDQPFQAVEALQMADWARNETANKARFIGFLDLHSYSQQVLFPYTYTCAIEPPNRESLEELAVGLVKAIRLSSGETYTSASACEGAVARTHDGSGALARVESGGGSAIDWFYHEMKARFSYQIKLRDTGSYGFLLPKSQIVPTGEEIYAAVKYFGDFLLGNNGIESEPSDEKDKDLQELRRRKKR